MEEAVVTGFIILLGGILIGFLLHRSDYCMAGMFRDLYLFKNSPLLKVFFLQVWVTMVLFFVARHAGFIDLYPPPNFKQGSLMTIIGGIVFGIGMVLAGGCVIGTLYKTGAGNVASMVAFGGLIIGSGLYAEVYPFFKALHEKSVLSRSVLLSEEIAGRFAGGDRGYLRAAGEGIYITVMIVSSLLLIRWRKNGDLYQRAFAEGYIQPYKTAMFLSFINLIIYLVSYTPMAISTAYAKLSAFVEKTFLPSHYDTIEYFKSLSYSVRAQGDSVFISGGPGAAIDHIFIAEIPLLAGVIIGSLISSISVREFRPFKAVALPRQLLSAFIGGMFLGFSSRMAGGCNVKFLMSGLPLLSIQGLLFLIGLLPGTYVGTVIFKRLVLEAQDEKNP